MCAKKLWEMGYVWDEVLDGRDSHGHIKKVAVTENNSYSLGQIP